MLQITVPGCGELKFNDLVLDFNGTLACDGLLIPGVQERLLQLAEKLKIHLITADTFGSVEQEVTAIPCELAVISTTAQAKEKLDYINTLGAETAVAVGNGRNDQLMLKAAKLSMVIAQTEGASMAAVLAADILVPDIRAALDLLLKPQRLIATLRT
ncbi:Soluble P-type ATPase [Desulfuromusa kysingii]|uniref:Soluble P-type ATPase n=1 Tax=Desulfuromusa kysingii TaxID=37625 RepID=A0A1H4E5D0_9BACT|nr:HAD family hydrolase [Desulfuromusa kysingii]SEA80223.1 Soluble P-type ATPase [Desulfuromusa kysingii]